VGGLGTIVAVATIFVFLVWVVWPLFGRADVGEARRHALAADRVDASSVVALGSDEYGLLAWVVRTDGTLEVRALEDGAQLRRAALVDGAKPTAVSVSPDGAAGALGFEDGSLRLFRLASRAKLVEAKDVPADLRDLAPGQTRVHGDAVAQRLPTGEIRLQHMAASVEEPLAVAASAIVRIDRSDLSDTVVLGTVDDQGRAAVHRLESGGMESTERTRRSADLLHERPKGSPLPRFCGVPGAGDNVLLLWDDGMAVRFDCRDLDEVRRAESVDLVEQAGARLTAFAWLLGKTTLAVGDSTGQVRAAFRIKPARTDSPDGSVIAMAHDLSGGNRTPVTALAPGHRTRLLAVGHADGGVHLHHVTSEKVLARVSAGGSAVSALAVAPKEDAFLARTTSELVRWPLAAGHPEASVPALFGKVWYEGLEKPDYVWQSTGGTDDFEPKISLTPLIFGTLKATFYSMLFGVPIALLAAVFTSEFLSARLRVSVKSVIEMMASLPSVVLGFLAAVVIAPFVQHVVPAVLTCFLVLPTMLLLAAHLWQLLPQHVTLHLSGWPRLALMLAVFPLSILVSGALSGTVERTLFHGDLLRWLNHEVFEDELVATGWTPPAGVPAAERQALVARAGEEASGKPLQKGQTPLLSSDQAATLRAEHQDRAWGGWTYLMFPLGVLGALLILGAWVNPWIRTRSHHWSRGRCALVALAKFAGAALAAVGLASLLGGAFTSVGWDPRGSFDYATRGEAAVMGKYIQQNSLVLGFVMGFAIIPIIYTLAEDALSSVPQHLRLGSLGAGATPWQTARRIIIPTAMSGLFSAVMIGLGRAVGETMIVLMATGNTSVMQMNWFNGFRTLAANIAVEMPEAVVGGTHYRVLFLAALTLFAITFVLNSVAEAVRQRFRKRAFQL
jgi:phosphate transport system permease protein